MALGRLLIFILSASVLLFGCGYTKLAVGKIGAKLHPTPERLVTSAPEKCFLVTGNVSGGDAGSAPLAVVAVARWQGADKMVGCSVLTGPGSYYLFLPEGRYQIMVFTDLNDKSGPHGDELYGRSVKTVQLEVYRKEMAGGMIKGVDITLDAAGQEPVRVPFDVELPPVKSPEKSGYMPSGLITAMDDERFDEDYGFLGLYQPSAFLERVNGFFYMLEEYDPGKIPIILVHGIHGTPKDLSSIVDGLDRDRYQPWFFYYPSGLRLETLARIFYETFLSKRAVRIDKMIIVAYSLGGLVVREAMNMGDEKDRGNVPRLLVSICTPYGGVDTAASAVAHSPVVVPSWIDLASDSDFISSLHRRGLPPGTDFDLFFAYGNTHFVKLGANDDGTISLKSQLNPEAQKEAARMRGFDERHSDILNNPEMLEEFRSVLDGLR